MNTDKLIAALEQSGLACPDLVLSPRTFNLLSTDTLTAAISKLHTLHTASIREMDCCWNNFNSHRITATPDQANQSLHLHSLYYLAEARVKNIEYLIAILSEICGLDCPFESPLR